VHHLGDVDQHLGFVDAVEEAQALAEKNGRQVDPDLVDLAGITYWRIVSAPPEMRTSLSPAAFRACRSALSMPSFTK
jgi:hypothetical protein